MAIHVYMGLKPKFTLLSPPMKNISTWVWGDYQWFLSGIPVSAITIIKHNLKTPIFLILSLSLCLLLFLSLFLFVEKLQPFGEDVLSQALRLYNSSEPCPTNDRCPERLYTTLVSDMRASCPSNNLAKQAAGLHKPKKMPFWCGSFLIVCFNHKIIQFFFKDHPLMI